jgi:thiamine-monophosphate kinase
MAASGRRTRSPRGEDERTLVAWLASLPATGGRLGDDAATFAARAAHVVTVDSQIAGVHFVPDLEPEVIARRLIAINLSDVAAMGARPSHAFLALAAPPGFPHRRFFTALLRHAAKHGLLLAGGDLARAPQVYASLTVIGERWPRARRWLRRDEARPGDAILLGGTVGESALGLELVRRGARLASARGVTFPRSLRLPPGLLRAARRAVRRHLLPEPQLELGGWLATRRRGAALDVSDGVARDLHRLCAASGTGAAVELERLPRPAGFEPLAAWLGLEPRPLLLGGGEDYVLLFTLPPSEAALATQRGARLIGRVERAPAITLVLGGGRREPLPDLGWDNLRAHGAREPVSARA